MYFSLYESIYCNKNVPGVLSYFLPARHLLNTLEIYEEFLSLLVLLS